MLIAHHFLARPHKLLLLTAFYRLNGLDCITSLPLGQPCSSIQLAYRYCSAKTIGLASSEPIFYSRARWHRLILTSRSRIAGIIMCSYVATSCWLVLNSARAISCYVLAGQQYELSYSICLGGESRRQLRHTVAPRSPILVASTTYKCPKPMLA